jgi:CubicO group peptidase (beta-lactamase class C family)
MGDLTQNITDLMDNYLAQGYPLGVAVAAYSGNQSFELTIGRGVANKESRLKAGPEVIFELGSVTKVFTATMLALQSSILDDSLSKHLRVKINNPSVEQVTLKQLATHTAGFSENVPTKFGGEGKDGAIYRFHDQYPPANSALVNFWNQWKPTDNLGDNYCWPCQVGTCWQYSNVGFVTLGYAVANDQYNTQLTAQITGPQQLNMPSTGALPPSGAKLAQGYMKDGNKAPGEAADLKSNALDMLTWLKAQLISIAMPNPLKTAILISQDTFFTSASQCRQSGHPIGFDMGLGWQIRTLQVQGTNQNLYTKDGASGLGGQSCWVGFVPSQNVGVAVLTNGISADQPPPVLGMQILDTLLGLPVNLQPARNGH